MSQLSEALEMVWILKQTRPDDLGDSEEAVLALGAEVNRLRARIERLEAICAAAYQMAGAYDAPVRFLDALALYEEYLAMTPEQIIDALLPVDVPDNVARIDDLLIELAESKEECLRMHAAGTRMAELYDAVFKCCKVVFYPSIDDPLGDYPIEHVPRANKDSREAITQRLEAWLDAQGAAVPQAIP